MNEGKTCGVNTAIGCSVKDCKHNCREYCSLAKIHVANTCSCDAEACTCCDSFERR